jgi:hypothetical protein
MREKKPRVLTMLRKYTAWTIRGRKHATTRMSCKPLGEYELVARRRDMTLERSGVVVCIYKTERWTLGSVLGPKLEKYAREEGFESAEEFVRVIKEINRSRRDHKVLKFGTPLYTHFYRVTQCSERLRHLYGKRDEVCKDD